MLFLRPLGDALSKVYASIHNKGDYMPDSCTTTNSFYLSDADGSVPVIMLAFAQHYTVEPRFAYTPEIRTSTVIRTIQALPNVSYV